MKLIYRIIDWFCAKFNYIPKYAQEKIDELNFVANDKYQEFVANLKETTNKLNDATAEILELRKHIENSKVLDMEELQEENNRVLLENDKLRHDLKEANKYFEEVESQVSRVLHGDAVFGFKKSMCFPGASTITSFTKENSICIAGRIVLEDSISAKMQQLASVSERYYLAHNQLIKYGLLERMVKDAASQGGIAYTLGYNKDCTATELYYAMEVKPQESILTIKEKQYTEG
jgi:regulator of replication initiation timing